MTTPAPWLRAALLALPLLVSGCATRTPSGPATSQAPSVLVPIRLAGMEDQRAQFRHIFCAANERLSSSDPEHIPCNDALIEFAGEGVASALPLPAAPPAPRVQVAVVLGLGWECLQTLLDPELLPMRHLQRLGYEVTEIHVDGLSSSERNAREIRDALLARAQPRAGQELILLAYSKGAIDSLQAIADYPEVAARVTALVSISGSIGGSPLADEVSVDALQLMRLAPGAHCSEGDGAALQSLKPHARQRWLAEHKLPSSVRYYSLATAPEPAKVSALLRPSQHRLGQVDPRNDGNLLPQDQLIPGGILLGYANADHWAVALPIARSNRLLGVTLVDQNRFPRNALWEAVVRHVEWDLARHEPAAD